MKKEFFIFALIIVFSSNLAYGSTYSLETSDMQFEISYDLNGDVIAMAVDENTTSFLIGITNVEDSNFEISLPAELISAENNEFVVLVDWVEVDYDVSTQNEVSILQFFVPVDSQELEIIGTQVIPEFPVAVVGLIAAVVGMVAFIGRTKLFGNLKY